MRACLARKLRIDLTFESVFIPACNWSNVTPAAMLTRMLFGVTAGLISSRTRLMTLGFTARTTTSLSETTLLLQCPVRHPMLLKSSSRCLSCSGQLAKMFEAADTALPSTKPLARAEAIFPAPTKPTRTEEAMITLNTRYITNFSTQLPDESEIQVHGQNRFFLSFTTTLLLER